MGGVYVVKGGVRIVVPLINQTLPNQGDIIPFFQQKAELEAEEKRIYELHEDEHMLKKTEFYANQSVPFAATVMKVTEAPSHPNTSKAASKRPTISKDSNPAIVTSNPDHLPLSDEEV